MRRRWVAAGLVWAATAGGAMAQGAAPPVQDAVAAARAALETAMAQAPLGLPVALFVKDRPGGYGLYEARDGNRFKSGEPMLVYLEPQGYKFKESGGYFTFGMTMDFTVLSKDGTILGGKERFETVSVRSHHRNTEWMLMASINIQNAPPGDYQLELVVHDQSSTDVARVRLPFTIEP